MLINKFLIIKMTQDGWVYAFSNPSMPGLIKLGSTLRRPEDRAKELFKTSIPTPFKIEMAKNVLNPTKREITIKYNLIIRLLFRII